MLTSLLMLREQVNPSSVSEDSFVETVSFPSILKPVNSHPPQVQYEVPRLSKKRIRWTLEEEERLIKGVNTYGEGRWTDIRRIMEKFEKESYQTNKCLKSLIIFLLHTTHR